MVCIDSAICVGVSKQLHNVLMHLYCDGWMVVRTTYNLVVLHDAHPHDDPHLHDDPQHAPVPEDAIVVVEEELGPDIL
jgi:hypothetical protein